MRIVLLLSCVLAARAQSLSVVNAADYVSQISPGSIASAFGANLPTDASTGVNVCAPGCISATVFASSAGQINFLVPDPLAASQVTVQVVHAGAVVASGTVSVSSVSPAIFTADNSGTGIFNGQVYDNGAYDSVVTRAVSAPNTLILYGTGWKHADASTVRVSMGSMRGYAGLCRSIVRARARPVKRPDSAGAGAASGANYKSIRFVRRV